MKPADLTPILLRCSALALLVGGIGWGLAGLLGGWLGGEALGLTADQMDALALPFLTLL
ncbi:MAG: hypothetical protein JNL34_08145, partial [Anaerolineae bacterium]|nr:hypothetical protein [Anaerolineae bacterium]